MMIFLFCDQERAELRVWLAVGLALAVWYNGPSSPGSVSIATLLSRAATGMADNLAFQEFVRRLRSGDPQAAADLVREFEPVIRVEVRRRLNDPYLNRVFDSGDICQSVLASFFLRAAAGQYELSSAEDLLKLLLAMARKKLASQARKQRTKARDNRRLVQEPGILDSLTDGPGPDRLAAGKELLSQFRALLTDEERKLADLRVGGHTWPEIAASLGGEPQARRKQLDRALNRAAQALGLEEEENA